MTEYFKKSFILTMFCDEKYRLYNKFITYKESIKLEVS